MFSYSSQNITYRSAGLDTTGFYSTLFTFYCDKWLTFVCNICYLYIWFGETAICSTVYNKYHHHNNKRRILLMQVRSGSVIRVPVYSRIIPWLFSDVNNHSVSVVNYEPVMNLCLFELGHSSKQVQNLFQWFFNFSLRHVLMHRILKVQYSIIWTFSWIYLTMDIEMHLTIINCTTVEGEDRRMEWQYALRKNGKMRSWRRRRSLTESRWSW